MAEQVQVTPVQKRAARLLIKLRTQTGKQIPPSLVAIANAPVEDPYEDLFQDD